MSREPLTIGMLQGMIRKWSQQHHVPPREVTVGRRAARELYQAGRRIGCPMNRPKRWERTYLGLVGHTMIYSQPLHSHDEVVIWP